MSEVMCQAWTMDAAKTIAGRSRLLGAQVSTADANGAIYADTGDLAGKTFEFRNESGSGDILFKFSLPIGVALYYGCGISPYKFMFRDKRILFTDGIYVPALSGGTGNLVAAKTRMVIFYEGA